MTDDDKMWQPPQTGATLTISATLGHWLCDGEKHVAALLEVLTKQGGYLKDEHLAMILRARHWQETKP